MMTSRNSLKIVDAKDGQPQPVSYSMASMGEISQQETHAMAGPL